MVNHPPTLYGIMTLMNITLWECPPYNRGHSNTISLLTIIITVINRQLVMPFGSPRQSRPQIDNELTIDITLTLMSNKDSRMIL